MHGTPKRLLSCAMALLVLLSFAIPSMAGDAESCQGWKQYDPRWASQALGGKTMKQVGCLATSVAILAVQAGLKNEEDFDPGVFAADMKKAGGFTPGSDLVWDKIPVAVPGLYAENPWAALRGTKEEKLAALKAYLDTGRHVIVAVKSGTHWVALREVSGGAAVMMDPGGTQTDLFACYAPSGVTRAAILRADIPGTEPAGPAAEPAPAARPAPAERLRGELRGLTESLRQLLELDAVRFVLQFCFELFDQLLVIAMKLVIG